MRHASVIAALVSAAFHSPVAVAEREAEGHHGVAARYPGDVGIENDPAVLFAEDFEEDSAQAVFDRWDDASPVDHMSLTADVSGASVGRASLLMKKNQGDRSRGARLYRRLLPAGEANGFPRIYARMYVKIDPRSDPIRHLGASLGGHNPPARQPIVRAGHRTRGDESFWTGVEPYGSAWRWDFYSYWMEMRSWQSEDGYGKSFYGNAFLRETAAGGWLPAGPEVRRGQWICVELMVGVNEPVRERNGEQAFWIDGGLVRKGGQTVSHLGRGFPRGSWLRDKWSPDARGSPFGGFRWRSSADLLVNFVWLYIYTEEDDDEIAVWFDDLVVATQYIGPIRTEGQEPDPSRVGSGAAGSAGRKDSVDRIE